MARRLNIEEVTERLNEVSKDRYTWELKEEYKNNRTRVSCKCLKCDHEWETNVDALLTVKTGCMKCAGKLKHNPEVIKEKIMSISKADDFTVQDFTYRKLTQRIHCTCNKCGYEWTPIIQRVLITKNHCHSCNQLKKEEIQIIDYFESKNIKTNQGLKIIENPTGKNRKLEIDIYLPEYKLGIEYNDTNSHSNSAIRKKLNGYFQTADDYHNYKTEQCKLMGITLIHISEKEYYNNKDLLDTIYNTYILGKNNP